MRSGDIADLRAQYRLREHDRLRQLATYDGGGSWRTLGNDISGFGPLAAEASPGRRRGARAASSRRGVPERPKVPWWLILLVVVVLVVIVYRLRRSHRGAGS